MRRTVLALVVAPVLVAGCSTVQVYPGPRRPYARIAVLSPGGGVAIRSIDNQWAGRASDVDLAVLPGNHRLTLDAVVTYLNEGTFKGYGLPLDFKVSAGNHYVVDVYVDPVWAGNEVGGMLLDLRMEPYVRKLETITEGSAFPDAKGPTAEQLAADREAEEVEARARLEVDERVTQKLALLRPGMTVVEVEQVMGPMPELFKAVVLQPAPVIGPRRVVECCLAGLAVRAESGGSGLAGVTSSSTYVYTHGFRQDAVVFDREGRFKEARVLKR